MNCPMTFACSSRMRCSPASRPRLQVHGDEQEVEAADAHLHDERLAPPRVAQIRPVEQTGVGGRDPALVQDADVEILVLRQDRRIV